jgi:hypothetical protein
MLTTQANKTIHHDNEIDVISDEAFSRLCNYQSGHLVTTRGTVMPYLAETGDDEEVKT